MKRELTGRLGDTIYSLLYHLVMVEEFRNLFYYRIRSARAWSILCKPAPTLFIMTPEIGEGLFIQHGFATIISAHSVGERCWINQQVTIGYTNETDCPVIGNDVRISAGAKVLGAIHLGDGCVVAANAVVTKDVPCHCVVAGVPAVIIKRDGVRVSSPL